MCRKSLIGNQFLGSTCNFQRPGRASETMLHFAEAAVVVVTNLSNAPATVRFFVACNSNSMLADGDARYGGRDT